MEATFFDSAAAFGDWLAEHHGDADELWVGLWRKGTGRPSLTWPEAVDEALRFGWIDGVRRRVDEERYAIRFTPRRPGSRWSRVNVAKAEALLAAGRMEPAGRAAFEARREQPREVLLEATRGVPGELDDDLRARLEADGAAHAFFLEQSASVRRRSVAYVMEAKRPETRLRRLEGMLEKARRRERWW